MLTRTPARKLAHYDRPCVCLQEPGSLTIRYEAERGCLATGASAVAVVAPDSLELVKLEHGKPDHYADAETYCLQAMLAPRGFRMSAG